jgi:thiol-disulfide isomerase/thioredoxin
MINIKNNWMLRFCVMVATAHLPAAIGAQSPPAVLHLRNGGHVPGQIVSCDQPNAVRWKSDLFAAPFLFPVDLLNTINFPIPPEIARPPGDYCLELSGGDVLFGTLTAMSGDQAEMEVPRVGRLRIQRSRINRMYRWRSSADVIYLGPNGLTGWQETSARKGWREEQGQPWTDQDGVTIRRDFQLPARSMIEFELSWKNRPDFVLALGVGESETSLQRAFRFEVWEHDLIVQRETEQEADVASVGEIKPGPGRVHLLAYLDQEQGSALVFSSEGKHVADLKVVSTQLRVQGGISLTNKRGDIRMERLRIGRWNGERPQQVEGDRSRIHRVDGSIVYGQVKSFDPARKEFLIVQGRSETRIPEAQIAAVYLSIPAHDRPLGLAAVYQDGCRISGELLKVDPQSLTLSVPGISDALVLPVEGLRSLVTLRAQETPPAIGEQAGILELEGARLPGRLINGREAPDASCLVWQPQGSLQAAALRPGCAGKIIYRDTPAAPSPSPPRTQPAPPPQGAAGFVVGFLSALNGNQPAQPSGKRKCLYLVTGDVIPSEISSIDDKGVTFRTSLSSSTFVPHEKVQAVELSHDGNTSVRVTKAKRERLLMLPRMQKDNPPTHLLRSRNGDFLRGRLIKMDDRKLELEIHLENKEIPRDRLSLIVWLHPELASTEKEASKDAPTSRTELRVQAVRHDGIRLTFHADRFADGFLSGKSDVLGPCQVSLKDVDQILIGRSIEKAAAQLAYQQWKLQDAPQPKSAQADPDSPSAGTESPLVGKPAPDFELDLLQGKKFRLSTARGKVVILDFWATWCGPCIQAMPQVERVADEFKDRGVQLIAVNLQEDAKQISSMLQRHKLHPEVALDIDGAVAEKYAAVAIPQTVVIDRQGVVARLFVGGGTHLGDQLHEVIKGLLNEGESKQPTP